MIIDSYRIEKALQICEEKDIPEVSELIKDMQKETESKQDRLLIKTGKDLMDSGIIKFEVVNGAWIGEIEKMDKAEFVCCKDYGGVVVHRFLLQENAPLDLVIKPLLWKEKEILPPVYESYEKKEGGFNLYTCFYSKEQVDEFASTAGKYILSACGINEMKEYVEKHGKYSFIWDVGYRDIQLIPKKYLPAKEDVTGKKTCAVSELRECMSKYLAHSPHIYRWEELGVNRFGELTYLHFDGSGDKLRCITGKDGYPDILNDRNESVFDYAKEMDMTQEEVNKIRGISELKDRNDLEEER